MMSTPIYKLYENVQPVGVYTYCNTFGVLVFQPIDDISCDYITCYTNNDGARWNFRRHVVKYSAGGRPYIRFHSDRIYLDMIMRIL